MNAPETVEGWQLWDLVTRLGGQFRTAGMGGAIGWDMTAALGLGDALSVPRYLIAEFLPDIEAAVIAVIRKKSKECTDD